MLIRGINHTCIVTPDYDRLVAFYRDVLEGEVLLEVRLGGAQQDAIVGVTGSSIDCALLRVGESFLEIQHYRTPDARPVVAPPQANDHGIRHIAFVISDLDAGYERFTAAGMTFIGPPVDWDGKVKTAYARDPDGNLLEIFEYLDPDFETRFG
jgi:glyoxylase I family protein